jgi:hypothetical protein
MAIEPEQSARSKQLKVWALMTATLVVGLLLAFGRWASDVRTPIGFGHVERGSLPAGWVLAIEYGMVVLMVSAVTRADRVGAFFSCAETLTWLGGIGLFTAGLYHDGHHMGRGWAGSINGYGTFTDFLRKPLLARLPLLLSIWPMAYSLIVVPTSFVAIMGWKRPFLHWRWALHVAFLGAVTVTSIVFVLWPWNMRYQWRWLDGSLVVLPVMVVAVIFVRDPDRKRHWTNLIAAAWLATALIPGFLNVVNMVFLNYVHWVDLVFHPLILGDLLILVGSISELRWRSSPYSLFDPSN